MSSTWACIFLLLFGTAATASIPAAIPPQNAVESDKPKTRCIQATTRQRFSVTADGRRQGNGNGRVYDMGDVLNRDCRDQQ